MSSAQRLAVVLGTLTVCSAFAGCRSSPQPAQPTLTYSARAIRDDFATLYRTLQDSAYDLFIYTDKTVLDAEYERLLGTITEPMSAHEVSRLFQSFVVMARMSHCTIEFPIEAYRDWYRSGGRLLPFDIIFSGDRVLIAVDWSQTDGIDPGDELLAVRGMTIDELVEQLFRLIPGENDQAKRASLETGGLWSRYWYRFGDFEAGPIRIGKSDGRVVELEVSGISMDRYRALSGSLDEPELMTDGRDFHFIGDIAYLRPGPFMNLSSNDLSEQETWDNTEFLAFLDSAFKHIASRTPGNLILDIRGNPGGSSSFSNPLIAYVADRPFREASSLRIRTSQITKEFWRDVDVDDDPMIANLKHQILTREDGERWSMEMDPYPPRSDSLTFTGRVFALIDRFSYSNAAAVASILQDYGFATLIGEETSFNPSNCGAVHTFELPHTGIEVVYPKMCGVRPSGDAGPHGVIPDVEVTQDYFTEEDEILQAALRFIRDS